MKECYFYIIILSFLFNYMKSFKNYIFEKLIIGKSIINPYKKKYGKGELKKFKDCNIYTNPNNHRIVDDQRLKDKINEYFNDEDQVYVIKETQLTNYEQSKNINLDKWLPFLTNPSFFQRVFLMNHRIGYYFKDIDGQILLVIKYFRANRGYIDITYIFKIQK